MIKAFKFRIYPNKTQEQLLQKTFGCVRFVWNHFLARKEKAFDEGEKGLGFATLSKELTLLKQEYVWLKEPDKDALQKALRHLFSAYDRFFKIQAVGPKYTDKKLEHLKRIGRKPNKFDLNGHPQWKRKKDHHKSYTTSCTNNNIKFFERHIQLPKIGKVKFRDKQVIEGKILSATISQEPSGKYFVSLCCTDIPVQTLDKTGLSVGIDLGLKEFAITSDGDKRENPHFLKQRLKKLKFLQRSLSRKTKGGKRWEKNRIKVARLYERIKNMRYDFLQKYTTELIKVYDILCLETLAVKNLMQNHKLAQSISDVSWYQFTVLLTYKACWYGKQVVQIDRFFASSQTCNQCGYKNPITKDLSVREWICPNCGSKHDRDINAAINILNEGLKILKQ